MTVLGSTVPYYGGKQVANPANVISTSGAPSTAITAINGTLAVDNATGTMYGAVSQSGGVVTWAVLGGASAAVNSVTGTANQVTASPTSGAVILSTPAVFIAPGSIASTTTLTGGTGITATTGNILASTGNITSTLGSVSAGTTVTAGTGITATTGNIAASSGNVSASGTVTGGTGVTATTGNVVATAGAVNAGTTMTAGTGITATTGNIQALGGDILATRSSAGADVTLEATNSDNTSGTSRAGVEIATGGASSGDPYLRFEISGVGASTMTMGLDNSASDLFVISNSNDIGTSNALTLSQAGALAATTTLTATLGAITATNGNFVGSTAGTGLLFNPQTATGAAASPVVLDGRCGRVTFSSVSIAAAADLTLTMTNSSITGAGTQVICSISGATTGSALPIKSKTASAGSLAIVITNGTGATTTTEDIVLEFLVVN